jgi:hypothetical protein
VEKKGGGKRTSVECEFILTKRKRRRRTELNQGRKKKENSLLEDSHYDSRGEEHAACWSGSREKPRKPEELW